ncbi:hypothetical protein SS50377_27620 [Spironucleus salmonicida]|uniref:Uncharacterized protein n=1 Tax=Spironucleus salmonicida TaxID=348837 RepID=A0A9P8LMW8_9EUKA|nr:hypothetical protein SS50377_27620 [Spironucleus salmonicida]
METIIKTRFDNFKQRLENYDRMRLDIEGKDYDEEDYTLKRDVTNVEILFYKKFYQ